MTKSQLLIELTNVNHSKEKRAYYSSLFITYPENIPILLDIAFDVKETKCYRAAWVLEFMCSADISYLIPHLGVFTKSIGRVKHDSAKRPMAKICELIAIEYYLKAHQGLRQTLSTAHKEAITETCFDWMIRDEKVAVKAYAMNALHLLGKDFPWIHAELRSVLEKDFTSQSAAYKARARHILKKIKT